MSLEFYEAVASSNDGSRLVVQHTHQRSGWAALPPALCSRLFEAGAPLPLVLELRQLQHRAGVALPSEKPLYVAWAGDASAAAGCVGLPGTLARALGLGEGASVVVRPLPDAPAAVSVTVEPASEDDWEIVELNAGYLEEQLLNQVGVASPQQPLQMWIRSVGVALRVTAMVPAAPAARLVRGTEVYVAPRLRVRPAEGGAAAGDVWSPAAVQARGGSSSGPSAGAQQDGGESAEDEAAAPLQAVLRVQPLGDRASSSLLASCSAASADATGGRSCSKAAGGAAEPALPLGVQQVFACPATLAACGLRSGNWVRLSGRDTKSLVKFASLAASELAAPGHLALTAEQSQWAGAPPYSPVCLQRLTRGQRQLILEAAELRAAMVAAPGREQPTNGGSSQLDGTGKQQQQQAQDGASQAQPAEAAAEPGAAAALADTGWLRRELEQVLQHLLPILGFTPRSLLQSWGAPRPGGLLVCGPSGSGKSTLLSTAAAVLQQHAECLTYAVTVRCREISSEGASQAQAQILPKVQEALDHLPSLLVFDDLDVLCPAEGAGPDGMASSADPALVSWLCDLLDHLATPSPDWGRLKLLDRSPGAAANGGSNGSGSSSRDAVSSGGGRALWPPLAVAATCKVGAALAAPLRAAGRLDHTVTLPAPTAESRAAILAAAAAVRGLQLDPQHVQSVAEAADGFAAADLEVLLDRALHVAMRRQLAASPGAGAAPLQLAASKWAREGDGTSSSSSGAGGGGRGAPAAPRLQLSRADLEAALEGFTPAAFWGTGTRQSVQAGVEGWVDVGGMEEARQALHEALELPTKYACLVAQAPLRLRTGVLLYGPPGCGKTHIVAAAVAAAKVRCITVSGPELLNKYIGASEAAVRDVFARAAAAAPAVLFFDEFDAIAPQRGHDNTGVTDRVVNQLLTELDGVEGLRGVCVVAATSRPDLIDAALLRPGRLDRLVFCGFPSPLERGQVLRALARGVQLAADVDLDLVGYNAEFYSGADLAALLAEAQLAAVHETLDAAGEDALAPGKTGGGRPHTHAAPHARAAASPPVIQARHLEAALGTARPSVPETERERLEAVYARFRDDRSPAEAAAAARDKGKGKRVSWA